MVRSKGQRLMGILSDFFGEQRIFVIFTKYIYQLAQSAIRKQTLTFILFNTSLIQIFCLIQISLAGFSVYTLYLPQTYQYPRSRGSARVYRETRSCNDQILSIFNFLSSIKNRVSFWGRLLGVAQGIYYPRLQPKVYLKGFLQGYTLSIIISHTPGVTLVYIPSLNTSVYRATDTRLVQCEQIDKQS